MTRPGWLVLCATVFSASPAPPDEPTLLRFERSQPHMGTLFRIVLYAQDEAIATRAFDDAFARIAALDAMMSDYRDDSELTALGRSSGGPPVRVSDDLFAVLEFSLAMTRQSDGAFDVTAGPAIRLWRRARRARQTPSRELLTKAVERSGHNKVRMDRKTHCVQLANGDMQLDLGGVAKGYACDQAIAAIKRGGISRTLVAGGGDVTVGNPPPGKCGWTVAVASPAASGKRTVADVVLANAAVSTSGDTEQFVELDGKRYSHIVDPRTGWALSERIQATVIAPDGMSADALATTVCVLGPDRGTRLVESIPHTASCVYRVQENGIATTCSRAWKDFIASAPAQSESAAQ